jgi:preprotein translocase subunit SecD
VRNILIGAGIGLAVGVAVDQTVGTYFRNEQGNNGGARAVTYIAPIALFAGIGAALSPYRTIYRAR